MVDLKKLVVELIQNGVNPATFDENSPYINRLYQEVEPSKERLQDHLTASPQTLTIHQPNVMKGNNGQDGYLNYDTQDAEEVEESLSLTEKESDLIKKALKNIAVNVKLQRRSWVFRKELCTEKLKT